MPELTIDARLENIDPVFDFINEQISGCPSKIRNQINIAVDEIFSNIARYAYQPDTGGVTVHIAITENDITVEFEDKGAPYNLLEKADPDTTLSAEDREIGGLSIFMVKKIMDSVEYCREGNRNILYGKEKTKISFSYGDIITDFLQRHCAKLTILKKDVIIKAYVCS
jgi:anti-sigma regulatory factor (Ser/Thr protein kinase)